MEEVDPESSRVAAQAIRTSEESNKRDKKVTVFLSEAEKDQMNSQRGRLSYSEFLRDRWLHPMHPHDPTYTAIGSVYQASLNLREAQESFKLARHDVFGLLTLLCNTSPGEEARQLLDQLGNCLQQLEQRADDICRSTDRMSVLASEMSEQHLAQVLKHRLEPKTKRRRRR